MLWDLPTGHFMLQCLHRKVIMNAWCKCHFYPPSYYTAGTTVRISIILMLGVRQMAAVTPKLLRRQSMTELVGVRVSNYLDSTVRQTDLSVAPSSWPLPSHATISQTCHVGLNEASLPRLVTHQCMVGVSS
jgi:hypothetical protein